MAVLPRVPRDGKYVAKPFTLKKIWKIREEGLSAESSVGILGTFPAHGPVPERLRNPDNNGHDKEGDNDAFVRDALCSIEGHVAA